MGGASMVVSTHRLYMGRNRLESIHSQRPAIVAGALEAELLIKVAHQSVFGGRQISAEQARAFDAPHFVHQDIEHLLLYAAAEHATAHEPGIDSPVAIAAGSCDDDR